jgi:hypothetical protein
VALNFIVTLEDSFNQTIATSIEGDPSPLNLYHKFEGGEIPPYYLVVRSNFGNTDYMITADDVVYEEREQNDDPASAQPLHNLSENHALVDFDGNIGPGGPEDGDSDDWYYFGTGGPNFHLHYTLTYDPSADVGVTLTDFGGQLLASSSGGGGVETIEYDFDGDDAEPYYLHVVSAAGTSDYTQNATLSLTNPGYTEQEDNDHPAQANPIGVQQDFTGNLGIGGDYDSDVSDYFYFLANPGDKVHWVVTLDAPTPGFQAIIFDSNQRPVGGVNYAPTNDSLDIHALIRSQDVGPFYIELDNFGPPVNYSIDGLVEGFDELETNDDHATANPLGGSLFQFFGGNLGGGGGAEYNGGPVDMFQFDADLGQTPRFTVFFDEGTGLLDGIMKDSANATLGFGTNNGDGTYTFTASHEIGPGDVAPFFLELNSASFYFDYWIARNQ